MIDIAGTLLFTPDGRVVLHRRDDKAPTSPNMLALFGGHVEDGEDFETAARRELAEEISLKTTDLNLELVADFEMDFPEGKYHFVMYKTVIPTTNFQVYEGAGSEVYTVEEALNQDDLVEEARYTIIMSQEMN